jgi:hypothetical protein
LFEEQTFRFAADAFAEEGQETRRFQCVGRRSAGKGVAALR